MKNRDSKAALAWITNSLASRGIPFALVGGIAANAYGSTRELNDIDIDVPDDAIPLLAVDLAEYLSFGPIQHESECFRCFLVGFTYRGQEIELSGADSMQLYNRALGCWIAFPTDLTAVEYREILGIDAPVMNRKALCTYKRIVARATDLEDVRALESLDNSQSPG